MNNIKEIIEIQKTNKDEIRNLTDQYFNYLTAPMDDMWELGIIGMSNYYKIILNNNEVGYFCIDDDNYLLQYFIIDSYLDKSKEIFRYILEEYKITEAYVSTIEPRYLSLCLDFQKTVTTHTLLYKDMFNVTKNNPIKNGEFHTATMEDFQKILDYSVKNIGSEGDWIEPYYKNIIKRKELFLLKSQDEIIGEGELRVSDKQKPYANLGVTVSKKYRKQGTASYILTYLKGLCYEQNLIPICSTTIENVGSQKAIKNAGLFAYNRILKVNFKSI